jgi:hypothetical protein
MPEVPYQSTQMPNTTPNCKTKPSGSISRISQSVQSFIHSERKEDVRCAIDMNHHQNELFRKLEEEDQQRRRSLLDKIERKVEKVNHQRHDFYRKRSVDMHKVNEKVEKKFEKHQTDVRKFDEKCS